jgi:hypothetical protein
VTSLTLHFPDAHGADTLALCWIGLLGTFVGARKGPPANIVSVVAGRRRAPRR